MEYDQYPEPPDLSTIAESKIDEDLGQAPIQNEEVDQKIIQTQPNTSDSPKKTSAIDLRIIVQIVIIISFLSVGLVAGFSSQNRTINKAASTNDSDYTDYENENYQSNPKTTPIESNTDTDNASESEIDSSSTVSIYDMSDITHGESHSCGIYKDHKAYCWGSGAYGQLGAGTKIISSDSPVAVNDTTALSGLTIKEISSGDYHTCVIASDNQAYCWGVGTYGQIGNGYNTPDNYLPQAVYTSGVLKNKTIINIDAASNYTCATASDSHTYCWGLGIFGRDEHQNLKSQNEPTLVN